MVWRVSDLQNDKLEAIFSVSSQYMKPCFTARTTNTLVCDRLEAAWLERIPTVSI